MYHDQRYLQSLHECYRDVYSEEQRPLPLDRMKDRANQYDKEARHHETSARAWKAIEDDRNKGVRGMARRVARKYAGPSDKDRYIGLKYTQDKLKGTIAKSKRDTINAVGDMRMQSPEGFAGLNKAKSQQNKNKSTKNSIRRFSLNREEYEYLLDCLVYEGYAEDYESAVNIAESMSDGWIDAYFDEGYKKPDHAKMIKQIKKHKEDDIRTGPDPEELAGKYRNDSRNRAFKMHSIRGALKRGEDPRRDTVGGRQKKPIDRRAAYTYNQKDRPAKKPGVQQFIGLNEPKSNIRIFNRRGKTNEEIEYLLYALVQEGFADSIEEAFEVAEDLSDWEFESFFAEDAYDDLVADLKKQYGDSAIITKPNQRRNGPAKRVAKAVNKRSDDSPLYADGTTKASQGRYKPNKPGQFTYHGD